MRMVAALSFFAAWWAVGVTSAEISSQVSSDENIDEKLEEREMSVPVDRVSAPSFCSARDSRRSVPDSGLDFAGGAPDLGKITQEDSRIGAGIGILRIDESLLLSIMAFTTFDFGPVHIGLQAPLRFRVYSLSAKTNHFQLRREDWDEFSDYLRIFRFVDYGNPSESIYARIGALTEVSLGHGTLMAGYYNSIDFDHFQAGVRANISFFYGGVETMLQSISAPRLLGGRVFIRPGNFLDFCSPLQRLVVGTSIYVDAAAPTKHAANTVDSKGNWQGPTRAFAAVGLDVEYNLVSSELFDITPYTDWNYLGGEGAGFHSGILLGVYPLPMLTLQSRLEYRLLGARYLPVYFDYLYEIQRNLYRDGKTKLEYLNDGGSGALRNGYYGELTMRLAGAWTLHGAFEDYQGSSNSRVLLRVLFPELFGFKLGAYYLKSDFEKLCALFDKDNALGIAEVRFQVMNMVSILGQVIRQWKLSGDGHYDVFDSYQLGVFFSTAI